jgi:hypothetical protein
MATKVPMATNVPMATKVPMVTNGNQWQPKDLKDKNDSNLQKEQNVLLAVVGFICNMAMGLCWS